MTTLPEALTLAAAHLGAGELAECEARCRQILSVVPEHPEALFMYGRVARHVGREDIAADVLERAARGAPNKADIHRHLAGALLALGRDAEADAWDCRAKALDRPEAVDPQPCRLCGGQARFRMFKTLLGRHIVAYGVCADCRSMQSEPPYWLDEAYGITTVGPDTGICQRTLQLVIETSGLLRLLGFDPTRLFVDFGGGNGLFTRMMRDRGFNFFSYDKYQTPFYSDPYLVQDLDFVRPAVLTAFEVFEHFVDPAGEIDRLLGKQPDLLVFTTDTYIGQGEEWGYLAPQGGQHIFFYAPEAFRFLSERYGMVFYDLGLLKLYVSPAYLAQSRLQGKDPVAALEMAADRKRFVEYALSSFVTFQAQWQERWIATMTPRIG